MSAREEIMTLINQYGFTIDTGDLDGFASLFEHSEWTVEGSPPNHGKDEVLAAIAGVQIYGDGTPKTKHVTANVELDIDEAAGKASGQCYVAVFQQTDDFALQPIFIGHYFDEFENVDGAWRFSKRIIRYPLVGDLSAHLSTPGDVVSGA
ncbi:MAG: nuclear transport factor 2 family protein [Acidimicrobiales bacterium]